MADWSVGTTLVEPTALERAVFEVRQNLEETALDSPLGSDRADSDDDESELEPLPGRSSEEAVALISRELLEREAELKRRNKELQSKAADSVNRTRAQVEHGQQVLDRPVAPPQTAAPAAEPASAPAKAPTRSAGPRRPADGPKVASEQPAVDADVPAGLGPDATVRYLKARLQVVQQELQRAVGAQAVAEATAAFQEKRIAALEGKDAKTAKLLETLKAQLADAKQQGDAARVRCEQAEAQLAHSKREHGAAGRSQRQLELDLQGTRVRLNRALEELDKGKSASARVAAEAKEKLDAARHSADALQAQNKRLERQRSDLAAAFKKQMQLIDVLKRQAMHLEAARALQFKEDEFLKALSWAD